MDPHSTPGAELPATDPAALDRLRRFGGQKLLREMIALFLATAPERIAAARSAGTRGDATAAEMAMHSLKSSSAQLGAMRMQRLSERGEHGARAGSVDGLAPLIDELDQEMVRVREWLSNAGDAGTP